MFQLYLNIEQSLIQVLHFAFSLVIHMALKDINSTIFILILATFISRNAIFHETIFPYASCSNQFSHSMHMYESVPSSIHFSIHPNTEFLDSMSPNTQQHNIVQSQNKNFVVFPNSETTLHL
jgi:hypothetical protein